jgi:predicted ATPase
MDGSATFTIPSSALTHPLAITLFGSLQATVHGKTLVDFRSNKARALLAYLLLAESKPVLRTHLTDLLWHHYTTSSARTNLRQALTNLRELLAPLTLLTGDYHTIQLVVDPAVVWCDALLFDELFAACQRHEHAALAHCPLCQARLQQAAALYTGPFLANFGDVDSAPVADWLQAQRTRHAARFAEIQALLQPSAPLRGHLPLPLTSLIGRTAEVRELAAKVLHPIYRCLTLLGPGGIGKTRLAIALGEQMRSHFVDGVWFVGLAALAPATDEADASPYLSDRLATAISTSLGLTLHGATHPTQQLTEYLHEKTLLLLLDNFEHLRGGEEFLVSLLQEAPYLRLVVTSRHRLALQTQVAYLVTGLSLPPEKSTEMLSPTQFIAHYASVELFMERAGNALFPVDYDDSTLATISALCRLLEGAPLGIELAVAMLETHSPSAILQAVSAHYTALQANLGDLPRRQRSAEAILRTTWQLLSDHEAQTLARCAVFRGGFTLLTAQQINEATASDLEILINKSLLHYTAAAPGEDPAHGRYTLHEMVRQFAAEQLARHTTTVQSIHDRHAIHYLALLEQWQLGVPQRPFHLAVQRELANIEAAWEWALTGDLVTHLPAALNGLAEFYEMADSYYAAEAILQRSVDHVRTRLAAIEVHSDRQPLFHRLLAALLGKLGYFYAQVLGLSQQALSLGQEGLALALAVEDEHAVINNYIVLQGVAYVENNFADGRVLAEKALALAQAHGLIREQIVALQGIGLHANSLADFATAGQVYNQALALAQQYGDGRREQLCRASLAVVYRATGDLAQAAQCLEENLPLLREDGAQYIYKRRGLAQSRHHTPRGRAVPAGHD